MISGRVAAFFLASLLSLSASGAQRLGNLYGRVLDTSEGGISDAEVTVVSQETGFRRSASSVLGGGYAVSSLEPGLYKVTVRREGFRTLVRFGVVLTALNSTQVDFVLPVGSTQETITVTGNVVPLEREDAAPGTSFRTVDIDRLPLNGAGLLNLVEAVPGTNITPATRGEAGQFTTAGQRPNANYFTLDGVSANNGITAGGLPAQSTAGTLPAFSAFGSMDSMITLSAVQDLSVKTSSTGAEMGRLPGAQVAVTSQSGGNGFHASTVYRWRNEILGANDWFANQSLLGEGQARLNDISQTFGGPLKRNHTFFFLAYQHMSLLQPFVWNQPVPSLETRQTAAPWAQPVMGIFPQPNQPSLGTGLAGWVGRSVQPAQLNAGSARLDQAIGTRVSIFGRYSDSPSTNEFGSLTVNQIDLRSQTGTLGITARPTPNTVLESRWNESQSSANSRWMGDGSSNNAACALRPLTEIFPTTPPGCDYLVRFTVGGVGQLTSGREGDRWQRQFQTVESLSFTRQRHSVQVGVDYRKIAAYRRDPTTSLGVIADSVTDLALGTQNLWLARSLAGVQRADVDELSLWLQDTWRVARRLTITAGLRWEYSPAPVPADGVYFLNYTSGILEKFRQALWPTSMRDFAPRLAVAYRLTGDGKTVLRAGGGLYYDSSMSIAADFINGGPLSVASYTSGRSGLFSSQLTFAFLPDLKLPEVGQWNLSLERELGGHNLFSAAYVGSAAWGLLRREFGGPGSTPTSWAALTTNNGRSHYESLQLQLRRRLAAGLDGLVSYTWSHSIDNDSSDAFLLWAGPGAGPSIDRGASDFDLRHSFNASASYTIPVKAGGTFWQRAQRGWGVTAIFRTRTGFPITVLASEQYTGITLSNAFRPLRVPGQPLWIDDGTAPGGRRLNPAAFQILPPGQQGNLGRNAFSGFGMAQVDLALSREFKIREKAGIEFRVDAFNATNHSNFADPVRYLNNPLFGQSPSMLNMMLGTGSPGSGLSPILGNGGPRMLQLGMRFRF